MKRFRLVCLDAFAVLAALAGMALGASAQQSPEPSPPGANDWTCVPNAMHPDPVVLVHGLGARMSENWLYLSPALANAGYCVFALTYGQNPDVPAPLDQRGGLLPMEESAQQLAEFVERVLAATGAARVDIVGHSEGSLMPNYYVKFLGGAARVQRYVGITPLWNGTNLAGLATAYTLSEPTGLNLVVGGLIDPSCGSCRQFLRGSDFLNAMNEGGAAVPGVTYTMIMTVYDELVVPWWSGFLTAPNATNIVLQKVCPLDTSEHVLVAFDPVVKQLVLNALDPAHARPPRCVLGLL
jgi:triacylglycerol esterase/lipase EstA (alpha/beta hydrolase family)